MGPRGGEETMQQPSAASQPRRFVLLAVVASLVLVADFVTKEIALAAFSPYDPIELLGGLLKLTIVFNSGAAFSIGTGITWFFSLVMIIVIAVILRISRKLRSPAWTCALGLILGGAAGNLIDRIWRAASREVSSSLVGPNATGTLAERLFTPSAPLQGHVVDWIQVPNFPVFNLADSGVVCGAILAVLLSFRGINLDGSREPAKTNDAAGGEEESASPNGSTGSASPSPSEEDDRE
ncbi:signal peptidase II [Salinactinospora qingdaonensis]|uniref:Lipoprotein signal peptidase n=1 Tax=Salinactinospora qingdaonensis TaxID=702744 RepID=A0ABP7FNC6_9ACTN